jgi:hypothetical protein
MVCMDCDGSTVSTRQGLVWFGLVWFGYVAFNEVGHLT